MFGIDEGRAAPFLLGLRDGVQSDRGLAARFGTIDFDDAAARETADAQSGIE